jgi:hypothetical protein
MSAFEIVALGSIPSAVGAVEEDDCLSSLEARPRGDSLVASRGLGNRRIPILLGDEHLATEQERHHQIGRSDGDAGEREVVDVHGDEA